MEEKAQQIFISAPPIKQPKQGIIGEYVTLLGDSFYKIHNFDSIEPFFMSIVSSSDHWLFVASNGGLSAGRVNSEQALFPYYTEDKLADNNDNTGSKIILRVTKDNRVWLWEPFTPRQYGQYDVDRNLYKNVLGTALVFEEINRSLELSCRYAWRTSDKFGFVKTVWIQNLGSSDSAIQIELLDGLQNILPANITSATQNALSCLLDAYKRSELDLETGLGIFALNSTLTDLAEPSESLLATTVFQVGLGPVNHLLSSLQVEQFRSGMGITPELDVRGRRGAYFVHAKIALLPGEESVWHLVADIHQDWADIVNLRHTLRKTRLTCVRRLRKTLKLMMSNYMRLLSAPMVGRFARTCSEHHTTMPM
jgi:hypothetical protein